MDHFKVIFAKLSDFQLTSARIALDSLVNLRPGSPYWLARTVALRAIDVELKRRNVERGSLMGGTLSEGTPDGN